MTLSKSPLFGSLFEILKMFYPPKGLCTAEYRRRSNCFYLCFFVLGNVYWIFKIFTFRRPFSNPENILSPEGTLYIRVPKEVQLFLLMFFVLGKVYCIFKILTFRRPSPLYGGLFEILKMFYLRMGWDGLD